MGGHHPRAGAFRLECAGSAAQASVAGGAHRAKPVPASQARPVVDLGSGTARSWPAHRHRQRPCRCDRTAFGPTAPAAGPPHPPRRCPAPQEPQHRPARQPSPQAPMPIPSTLILPPETATAMHTSLHEAFASCSDLAQSRDRAQGPSPAGLLPAQPPSRARHQLRQMMTQTHRRTGTSRLARPRRSRRPARSARLRRRELPGPGAVTAGLSLPYICAAGTRGAPGTQAVAGGLPGGDSAFRDSDVVSPLGGSSRGCAPDRVRLRPDPPLPC
jgi:hypothetical protein